MNTPMLMLLLVLSGAPAAGQAPAPAPQTVQTAASADAADSKTAFGADDQGANVQPKPAEVKRRGSMVGYIEDATVTSHFRVRFDAGFNGLRPDRAEFFYAKCGCYKGLATAVPVAFDPDAPGPFPVITEYDYKQVYFEGQYGIKDRIGLFVEIPVRWLEPGQFLPGFEPIGTQSGLSDIRAGVKLALSSTPERMVTVLLRGDFPSGDPAKGLGTNHGTFVPALLYSQRVDRFAIESQFGDFHPLSGSGGVPTSGSEKFSGDVLFYGIGPSYEVVSTNHIRFAPVVELVGWHVFGGFQTEVPGDAPGGVASFAEGINIVNLKIGARTTIDDASSIYVGYGRRLTKVGWYDDILRLEFRYGF